MGFAISLSAGVKGLKMWIRIHMKDIKCDIFFSVIPKDHMGIIPNDPQTLVAFNVYRKIPYLQGYLTNLFG